MKCSKIRTWKENKEAIYSSHTPPKYIPFPPKVSCQIDLQVSTEVWTKASLGRVTGRVSYGGITYLDKK